MSSVKTFVVVGLCLVGGYLLVKKASSPSSVLAREKGFVEVPWVEGAQRDQVLIIGPPCANMQKQMNAMVAALAAQQIPSRITSDIRFAQMEVEEQKMAAARGVFESDVPIVFINGKAKSKPTIQEVVGEYQQSLTQRAK